MSTPWWEEHNHINITLRRRCRPRLHSFSKSNSLFPEVEHGVIPPHEHISQYPASFKPQNSQPRINGSYEHWPIYTIWSITKEVHGEEECQYRWNRLCIELRHPRLPSVCTDYTTIKTPSVSTSQMSQTCFASLLKEGITCWLDTHSSTRILHSLADWITISCNNLSSQLINFQSFHF